MCWLYLSIICEQIPQTKDLDWRAISYTLYTSLSLKQIDLKYTMYDDNIYLFSHVATVPCDAHDFTCDEYIEGRYM